MIGFLLDHERVLLENKEAKGRKKILPLFVIDWLLLLIKKTNKDARFMSGSDFSKNMDLILAFKKSCGNIIKFASKNIPIALIQVLT